MSTIGFIGDCSKVPEPLHGLLIQDIAAAHPKVDVAYIWRVSGQEALLSHLGEYLRPGRLAQEPPSRLDLDTLYVYWDAEDTDLIRLVTEALGCGSQVRDLCDALTRIETPTMAKETEVASTTKIYTQDELRTLTEEETAALAVERGIDPEDYATWEEVEEAILAAQGEGETPEPEEEDEEGVQEGVEEEEAAAEEEEGYYTEEELDEIAEQSDGLEQLKEICEHNGITIPGARPRKATLKRLILDLQASGEPAEEAPAPPTTERAPRKPQEAPAAPETDSRLDDLIREVQALREALVASVEGLAKPLEYLRAPLEQIASEMAQSAEPERPVKPSKGPVKTFRR